MTGIGRVASCCNRRSLAVLMLAVFLPACTVNPVTGERELGFVSEQQELELGRQNYAPMRQSQGGRFTTAPGIGDYVSDIGNRLAQVSDRDLPYEFTVLNNGVPNAWALPGGKIAINRGLLVELGSEAELAAVLGHEIVHSAARHSARSMERNVLLEGAMLATVAAADDSEYAGYLLGGARIGAQLISQRYSREAEREADRYGTRYMAEAGYDPAAAVDLQQTFVRLSEGGDSGWLEGLFASHPPSTERVENNRQLVQQLRDEGYTGGERGEQTYREELAFLMDNQQAYEAFDEARELLGQGQTGEAMENLETALDMVPEEPRFHGLRGHVLRRDGEYDAAIDAYDRAIGLDDGYFEYYLGRGLAYRSQGRAERAVTDLQASVDLLPTAQATSALGRLALDRGDRDQAKRYFEQAAEAPGELGQQAQRAFARLDIVDNPRDYLAIQPFLGDRRQVMLRVTNQSPITVRTASLQLRIALDGRTAQRSLELSSLGASQTATLSSGLTVPEGMAPSDAALDVQVSAVRPVAAE